MLALQQYKGWNRDPCSQEAVQSHAKISFAIDVLRSSPEKRGIGSSSALHTTFVGHLQSESIKEMNLRARTRVLARRFITLIDSLYMSYLIPFLHCKFDDIRKEDSVEGVADGKVNSCPQSLVAEVSKLIRPGHI